ncbi:ParB/RepB/Spo0J family partition protein [Glycomyces sp. NRRL B-16210]|uniref:ParB/RepB/Spo0J family partition protein n=1 Tax=Glycomyces sp. NRRL B-16210 TaxID=1463821 RepID=UPI00055663DE|nr:ParB/RepB/Spo0J family partition protein [Glycomyces sp. NRRL B-16210]
MELTQIPATQLVPHENNAHSELRGIDALAKTVAYLGIIEPLIVLPADEDGRHTIVAGHRRHAAATQVGLDTVPCIVVDDPGAANQLVTMLAENLHRDDLTVLEEAQTYQQLTLLDWEPERIAQATGSDLDRVQQSLTLHKLPEQVQQAAHAGQVDLVSAAALAEFTHDPKVIERIMKKAGGHWSVQHLIAEERHRQGAKDTIERLKAELVLAGVKVTPRPDFHSEGCTAVRLEHLVDADGHPVDAETVKSEPGFAAYINRDYGAKAEYYCPDPAAVGLRPAPNSSAAHRAERDARDAESEARRAAWEAATGVRTDFLLSRFGTAKGAKILFRPALRELAATSMRLPYNEYAHLADALCGCEIRELPENAGMDRLTRATVARWLARCEENLSGLVLGRWGDLDHALAYLDLLVTEGYELAEVEAEVRQSITDRLAEKEEEEVEEEDTEEDEGDGDASETDADVETEAVAEDEADVVPNSADLGDADAERKLEAVLSPSGWHRKHGAAPMRSCSSETCRFAPCRRMRLPRLHLQNR